MENQSAIEKLAFEFTIAYGGCYLGTVLKFGYFEQQ